MIRAIILSKGGTARELAAWLRKDYEISFLDDLKSEPDILGPIADWRRLGSDALLFSALGSFRSMSRRRTILESIPIQRFPAAVSGAAICYDSCDYPGLLVFPGAVISVGVKIGLHVLVYHNAVISHDCELASFCMISNSVTLSGGCRIGENCYIGAGSTVLEGRTIGKNCIIAAGATVIHDVPDDSIYISPRKLIKNHYL